MQRHRAQFSDDWPESHEGQNLALQIDAWGQLDQLQERISQLEERVDFAERILVKQREGERLGLPKD